MGKLNYDKYKGHSEGNWKICGWSIIEEDSGVVICKVLPWDVSGCRKEDHSNMNLISDAPKLLKRCKELEEALEKGKYND